MSTTHVARTDASFTSGPQIRIQYIEVISAARRSWKLLDSIWLSLGWTGQEEKLEAARQRRCEGARPASISSPLPPCSLGPPGFYSVKLTGNI